MPSVIRISARVLAAVGPLPPDWPQSGRRRRKTWTGLVVASMPERSWLVIWDQLGKGSIHSGRSLKFIKMTTMSEANINALRASLDNGTGASVVSFIPPAHGAISALQDQQNQELVLPAKQSAPSSGTHQAQSIEHIQQLTTGEAPPHMAILNSATAKEPLIGGGDDNDEDPNADDNEHLRFDAEVNGTAGFDSQHDDGADEHRLKWLRYVAEKGALMGSSVMKGQGASAITWTVRHDVTEADIPPNINDEFENIGVKCFDLNNITTISYDGAKEHMNLLFLLMHLWPGDWRMQINHINNAINMKNNENAAKMQVSSLDHPTHLCP